MIGCFTTARCHGDADLELVSLDLSYGVVVRTWLSKNVKDERVADPAEDAIGVLEGTVQAVSQGRDTATQERDTWRASLADTSTKLAILQVENDAFRR